MKNPPARKPSAVKSSGNKFIHARQRLMVVEKNRKSGKLEQALSECQALLRQFPDYVGALHNIGLIYSSMGDIKNAIFNLSYAGGLDPQNLQIQLALAKEYIESDSIEMALIILKRVDKEFPANADVLSSLGLALNKSQEFEKALTVFDRALELDPKNSACWKGKSLTLVEMGRNNEAAISMLEVVNSDSSDMTVLGYVSKFPSEIVDIDLMKRFEMFDKSTPVKSEECMARRSFTKANILFSTGNLEEGFKYLQKANRIKFSEMKDEHKASVKLMSAYYSALEQAPVLRNADKQDDNFPTSVFILGPSRSGKSSLESLLGIFPSVQRGYESSIVKDTARKTCAKSGMPNRDFAFQLPPALDGIFREFYVKDLRKRTGDKCTFTITTPGRIHDAYHLARIIPNPRFIFIKRDIEDVVYSMYNSQYSVGNTHTYDLDAAREYVNLYYRLQDKLTELLPGITMTLTYEEMVQDTAGTLETVKAFCGIEGDIGNLPDIGDDRGYAQKFAQL